MSNFLHNLWDETLAGPAPDAGKGKLRKTLSSSASQSPAIPMKVSDEIRITRSITVLRTKSNFKNSDDRTGDSLAGVTSPRTPTTPGTPGGDLRRFSWRNSSKSLERDA